MEAARFRLNHKGRARLSHHFVEITKMIGMGSEIDGV